MPRKMSDSHNLGTIKSILDLFDGVEHLIRDVGNVASIPEKCPVCQKGTYIRYEMLQPALLEDIAGDVHLLVLECEQEHRQAYRWGELHPENVTQRVRAELLSALSALPQKDDSDDLPF